MNFELTHRAKDHLERVAAFMDERIYPAESIYEEQMRESGNPHFHPPILEELKAEARSRGLWNLFHPDPEWGAGLTNAEYAPLAELMGRSPHLAPEAMNCSAPDTGNMEVLTLFGTEEHQERWLRPLLAGEIRSAFAMTEPAVASSDATNIQTRIERDGDEYVINGRKWWTSNALHRNCRVLIVMGKTDPDGPAHRRQSMLVVPLDTPGVTIVRGLPVFGYQDREGHAEVLFEDVRVPASALLAGVGDGFMISQARLGPGRIHHCMRSLGMAERALDLLCRRALERSTFGKPVAENANVQDWIAEARIELEMVRLLTMKTAWLMDTVGNRHARVEIAAIKVAAPQVALKVIDRAIQVHGGGGVSDDFPLAYFYAYQRTMRLADGPDEVHKRTIAQRELRRWAQSVERPAELVSR
ncbi:acyl-CoA dehydrogenase family protein [Solirubrobacter ginsenosidimutans]|uniref:Acyl-CoA dehydrogenase family protein n=1 Tax=Solirubrobacter ginsenosidimutans TaxID=490573 RepID=A0A9X3S8C2_9ACTN|nr:acyl-CoA dehydrogenase family protein [Solirubrobacter ginsenosidimutans]MDA0166846.1 acyl-CoA dehydrogenase family protein [Solirubrobacter ginsenosidimutans]